MDVRALIDDDQRPFKLAHLFRIDAEIRLQRFFQFYPFRDIDERTARPHSAVERGELVVGIRHNRREVLLHQFRNLLQSGVGIQENDALLLNFLQHVVINRFRFILGVDAG